VIVASYRVWPDDEVIVLTPVVSIRSGRCWRGRTRHWPSRSASTH